MTRKISVTSIWLRSRFVTILLDLTAVFSDYTTLSFWQLLKKKKNMVVTTSLDRSSSETELWTLWKLLKFQISIKFGWRASRSDLTKDKHIKNYQSINCNWRWTESHETISRFCKFDNTSAWMSIHQYSGLHVCMYVCIYVICFIPSRFASMLIIGYVQPRIRQRVFCPLL